MYANADGCRITDLEGRTYRVSINSYNVCISTMDRRVVFRREFADADTWLDAPHRKITKALSDLERALREAVGT